jgi:hypothetical protein
VATFQRREVDFYDSRCSLRSDLAQRILSIARSCMSERGPIPSIFDIRHSSENREISGCARLRGNCRLAVWPAPFKLHYVCRSSGLRQGPVRRNHRRAIRALLYRNTGDRFTTRFSKLSAERQLPVMVNELIQPRKRAANDPTKMGISLIRSLSDVEALPAPVGGGAPEPGSLRDVRSYVQRR